MLLKNMDKLLIYSIIKHAANFCESYRIPSLINVYMFPLLVTPQTPDFPLDMYASLLDFTCDLAVAAGLEGPVVTKFEWRKKADYRPWSPLRLHTIFKLSLQSHMFTVKPLSLTRWAASEDCSKSIIMRLL